MFLQTRSIRRRGNVLIVTMLLLALFAIVAVTMVYYATGVAQRARIVAEAADAGSTFPDDGTAALNSFLGQFTTGTNDSDITSIYSALRHQDLARNIYGGNVGAAVPFNGVGLYSQTATTAGINRLQMINYSYVPGTGKIYDREYMGERSPTAAFGSGGPYVGCNAPYTYPDNNNAFLAVLVPGTGEVLVPSFFRQNAFGSLDPSNPNWTNTQGRYLTLRPRPIDHNGFPYPEQNANGGYSGDVKNLVGAPGGNDSIWMDIGLPIITLADGRRVKPLVAPLIVDLDGRLSLSVHGNRLRAATGPPPYPDNFVHTSGPGLGPWDVNLERVLPNSEARYIVGARGQARNQGGSSTKPFARLPVGGQLPAYAPVAWAGYDGATGVAMQYPSTNIYKGYPDFAHGYDATNSAVAFHPSLFNPTEWPTSINPGSPRSFPLSDTKLLSLKYAAAPSSYIALDVASQGQPLSSIRPSGGAYSVPNPNPPGATTQNAYRIDPNHQNRFQFTTTPNFSLDLPGLMPNFLNQTTGTALARDPVSGFLVNPSTLFPFPAPQAPGAITDFGNWYNVRAALGAIDLNRTLADYRDLNIAPNVPVAQPLAPNNLANELLARLDRQRFARDIFARLIVATGAQATVDNAGNVTIVAAPGTAEFNALRALAQIAANIVDYIDSDDISTPFVFNPINPALPQDPANFAPAAPGDVIGNHVVFGVEKPRVVLSEVYAEVCNDPKDTSGNQKASNPAQIRFWLELQNPTGTLAGAGSPMGAGEAYLYYAAAGFNPYRVEIVQNGKGGGNVSTLLRNPADPNNAANVKGDINFASAVVTPDLTFNFLNAGALSILSPANGLPGGIVVCSAAALPAQSAAQEFNPPAFATSITGAAAGQPDSLTYLSPLNKALNGTSLNAILKNHTVVLRRLSNPYVPESPTNPFVTVDFMDNVSTFDAILRADGTNTDRSAKAWTGMAVNPGYDPVTPAAVAGDPIVRRHSLGKAQPYAGYSGPTAPQANQEYPSFTFPNSLVLAQVDFDAANMQIAGVQQTLGYQNSRTTTAPAGATYVPAVGAAPANLGVETLMTPYDWLVHLDRPLINQLELLHVTAGKPHELTQQFMVPNNPLPGSGRDVQKFAGAVQWLPTAAPHPYANPNPNGLLRAFDLLRIQPYGNQMPFGGLVAGRININTIWDKRVWDAVFDVPSSPPFVNNQGFTQAQVDAMWTAMMTSRSPNGGAGLVAKFGADGNQLLDANNPRIPQFTPVPGASIFDMNAANNGASPPIPYDRPFLPFGAPQLAPGSAFALGGAGGIDDTILRRDPATGKPMLWVPNPTGQLHPYQQAEAAQKVMNNFTTVSNNFAVWLTVGYFEVTPGAINSGVAGVPNADILGKEYYREVPGDTRHRFFSIIDRTQLAMDAGNYQAGTYTAATATPYFTTVEASALAGSPSLTIYAPGGQVFVKGLPVMVGGTLAIGVGANREFVTIATITGGPTFSTLALTAPLARDHAIGECVSNVVPGNPGPQPGFDLALPQYSSIVPHASRVQ